MISLSCVIRTRPPWWFQSTSQMRSWREWQLLEQRAGSLWVFYPQCGRISLSGSADVLLNSAWSGAVMDPSREPGHGDTLQPADGRGEREAQQRGREIPADHHGCQCSVPQTLYLWCQTQRQRCCQQGQL